MSSPEHKQKVWNMIKDIKVGMLVTLDGQNDLHARPMHLVQKDYDGILWFFTRKHSAKTDEVSADRDVCITFAEEDEQTYVSLTGRARTVQPQDKIEEFWNPFVAAWFEGGKDDPEVALLEVHIHKGEYWNADDNKMVQLYEIAKANFSDDVPDMGDHQKFG